jgi:hypothetical protein
VVAVDENGIPGFQLLHKFQKQPTAPTIHKSQPVKSEFICTGIYAKARAIRLKPTSSFPSALPDAKSHQRSQT